MLKYNVEQKEKGLKKKRQKTCVDNKTKVRYNRYLTISRQKKTLKKNAKKPKKCAEELRRQQEKGTTDS